jgi:hypothetical protein
VSHVVFPPSYDTFRRGLIGISIIFAGTGKAAALSGAGPIGKARVTGKVYRGAPGASTSKVG